MTRNLGWIAAVGALTTIFVTPQTAQAQYNRGGVYPGAANPYNSRPVVSPYLNLLQPNGPFNLPQYQTLVKPQLDQQALNEQNAIDSQRMRRQIGSLQNQFNGAINPGRTTGHPTRYMNYSHYYPLMR